MENWKNILSSESESSKWEIVNHKLSSTICLHYVPNDDYSSDDIKINMSYDDFIDLCEFIKKLDNGNT